MTARAPKGNPTVLVHYTREPWGRAEWVSTLLLLVVFFPVGVAALWRWVSCQYVWLPDLHGERRPG